MMKKNFYFIIILSLFYIYSQNTFSQQNELSPKTQCQMKVLKDFHHSFKDDQLSPSILEKILPQILRGKELQLLYKKEYKSSLERAIEKLSKNTNHLDEEDLSPLNDGGWSFGSRYDEGKTFCEAPLYAWAEKNKTYLEPLNSPQKAMDCFYKEQCLSECAVGAQVAFFASLRELFQDTFDSYFNKDEISIGMWTDLKHTYNVLAGEEFKTRSLKYYSFNSEELYPHLNPLSLVGTLGYISNSYGEDFLDSPSDRGENFLIVDVNEEAAKEFSQTTLDTISAKALEAWKLLNREIENELIDKPINSYTQKINQKMAKDYLRFHQQLLKEIEQKLSNPIFTGIKVYVHPVGLKSLKDFILMLLKLNPRTPYHFKFYEGNINTLLFERYIESKIALCLKENFSIHSPLVGEIFSKKMKDSSRGIYRINHINGIDRYEVSKLDPNLIDLDKKLVVSKSFLNIPPIK